MKPILFVLFLFFSISCSVKDPDESMVLARVGDRVLTAAKLETLLAPEFRTEERVRSFVREWVDDVVLFLAAVREGYHNDKNLLKQKDDYFKKIVVGAYLQSETIPQIEITKSDILERTSQRGSTFIYVPQKRGTPLIGSNVATVLCFHKKNVSISDQPRKCQ